MRTVRHRQIVPLAAAALVGMASTCISTGAVAQGLIFDWGGDTVSDSGKQTIKFNAPAKPGDIIVSFGDRRLYFVTAPGIADSYPIAIPREQSRWEGITSVSQKRENPSWTPTPTMMAENPRLPRWVPGGHPMNPLGNRALYLGSSAYRIHGTDAPWTIGTAASKGCVRLFNKDVADLYPRVKVGAKVTVTWATFTGGKAPVFADGQPAAKAPRQSFAAVESTQAQPAVATSSSEDDADDVTSAPKAKRAETARAYNARNEGARVEKASHRVPKSETAKPVTADSETASDAKPVTKAAAEPVKKASRPESQRQAKLAAPKPSTIETGSVVAAPADKAPSDNALDVAQRAEAAAQRAADAAERAAAAAERVLARQKSAIE